MYLLMGLVAYGVDFLFGEFRFVRHPIIMIGAVISGFEMRYYHDSRLWGGMLVVVVLSLVWGMAHLCALYLHPLILGVLASMFLAHHMLYTSVKEAIDAPEKVAYLVSRDTKDLSESDRYKALIETYAENLSDGVIAPLFYLLLFGFEGIVVYKAINTLDSMVGYKTPRFARYGYVSAKLDDVANLIPARLTALLLMALAVDGQISRLIYCAKKHASPNAGYPICAMAYAKNLRLGGPTPYHGEMVAKPYFGAGKKKLEKEDVFAVLGVKKYVDGVVFLMLLVGMGLKVSV